MQQVSVLETNIGSSTTGNSADTQIIFNDAGTLRGDTGLVYNKTTDALTVAGALTVDTSTLKVDATNHRVGIGTATPSSLLTLNKASGAYSLNMDGGGYGTMASFGIVNVGVDNNAYIGTVGNNNFLIQVANSTRATFDQNGHFNLANGNVVMTTSGKGIDFSATANSSGTMTSELLNDYEEGTFLPNVQGSTTTGVGVYSTTDARYTKVGRLVTAEIYIVWSAHTGTGDLRIGGLPFTANASFYSAATIGLASNIALSASNTISAFNQINSTFINIIQSPVGGGAFSYVPMDVAGTMVLSITYSV